MEFIVIKLMNICLIIISTLILRLLKQTTLLRAQELCWSYCKLVKLIKNKIN